MNKEKKNRITSLYVAFGVHGVLVLVFFLMVAWSEPDPPIQEYGIEFNLGAEFISNSKEESKPVEAEELSTEEELKEVEETTETIEEIETQQEEIEEPVEEVLETPVEETTEVTETEDIHSPDVVEKQEEKEEIKEEVKKPIVDEPKEEASKEATVKISKPKIDDRAIFRKSDSGTGTGNKGASLDLSGWMWDDKPNPNDQSTENGYIIFEIKVDDEGEIIAVKTLEKTVSPVVEQVYKESVRDLTFSRTADNSSAASISTGKITFIIQSK